MSPSTSMASRPRPARPVRPRLLQAGADVVRWEGDQVALVVAESEEAAARARDLIHVEYQDLPS